MSEEDKDSKTEVATEKKVRDALEKGNIPFSREAPMFASFVGILIVMGFSLKDRVGYITPRLTLFIDRADDFRLNSGADASSLFLAVFSDIGLFLLPLLLIVCGCSLVGSFAQNVPSFVGERIKPKWSKISPVAGFKRIFGKAGWVEFGKSLFKFGTVGVVGALILASEQHKALNTMFSDPSLLPELLLGMSFRLVSAICIAIILLVAADLIWARYKWGRDLMMTKQEVKEEHKQMEGDPMVKARLRAIAQDRSRKRMFAEVAKATVIIANPTHFAVALRYDRSEASAPVVLAKGQDLVALKIREIAERNHIPIIEDKPLARSLYDAVRVEHMIPEQFYKAVAQILFTVMTQTR